MPTSPTQTRTTIRGQAVVVAEALESYGVDSRPVLLSVGAVGPLPNDPMQRFPVGLMTRLYRASVEASGDAFFGLTVARFMHTSNLHAVGHGLASSDTLLDFCHRAARGYPMISNAATSSVTEIGGEVTLRFVHQTDIAEAAEDTALAYVVLAMRQLSHAGFRPRRVEFHHLEHPVGSGPYEAFFRAPILFGQAETALVFARSDLLQTLSGSCVELAQLHDNIVSKYLALLDQADLVHRVKHLVIELLPNGHCTRETVARALAMSPSTLQARLSKRETSFQSVMEEVRQDLADSYVRQPSLSVTDIAYLLGFSDTSNFTRAFKRWTGRSPTEFRTHSEPVAHQSAG